MKHILILEDEQRNANRLVRLLKEIVPEARIDGPLVTIEAAAEFLRKAPASDLILADIRLSDGFSFEALKEAPPAVPIIFTTAYDEYAVQAFKYNSFDYLLKPIDADELAAAIEKVGRSGRNTSDEPLRQLFEALQQGGCRYRERFLLPYRDGYKTVSVREINHIFTENKIVRLHLDDGTSESVSVSMDELERQLDPTRFFRANRQVHRLHGEHPLSGQLFRRQTRPAPAPLSRRRNNRQQGEGPASQGVDRQVVSDLL